MIAKPAGCSSAYATFTTVLATAPQAGDMGNKTSITAGHIRMHAPSSEPSAF